MRHHDLRRIGLALFSMVAATSIPMTVTAQPSDELAKNECIDGFEQAQSQMESLELLAARETLSACASESCQPAIRERCISWLEQVRAGIPTLVVTLEGAATTSYQVEIDGAVRATSLDGRPIEVDPGPRRVVIVGPEGPVAERTVVANHGQKSQLIELVVSAPVPSSTATTTEEAPPEPEPAPIIPFQSAPTVEAEGSAITPLAITALVAGGVGLVVGSVTGAIALSKGSELDDVCTDGRCPASEAQDAYDTGTTMADVSTVAFVAGGVLAAAGVTLLLVGSSDSSDSPWVAIAPGLAGLAVSGRF